LDHKALSPAQKEMYDRLNSTMVPWADGAQFQGKTSDGRLIGPFNPIHYGSVISKGFMDCGPPLRRRTHSDNTMISDIAGSIRPIIVDEKMQFPSLTEAIPQGRSYHGYHPVGRNA
jgi:hypothetical protein